MALLAERERQLREVTDQSLGFLEELQRVRDVAREREALQGRVRELEQVLDLTRWKLREAGGVVATAPTAGDGVQGSTLQLVWWGPGSAEQAVACRRKAPELLVAWVGTPVEFDAVPRELRTVDGIEWIVHKDARTPAQCWNLAMVAGRADFVLLASAGAELARHDAASFVAACSVPSLAIASPVLTEGGLRTLGCNDPSGLLDLHGVPFQAGSSAPVVVAFPSARAFVVRRAAFERLGCFQEDLLGEAALWEFVHRARSRGHSVGALVGTELHCTVAGPSADTAAQLERLLVLASWHPDRLSAAFARSDSLWQVDKPALLDLLRRVFARMPASDPAAHRALVEQVATGIVEHTVGSEVVARLVRDRRIRFLESLDTVQHEGLEAQRLAALERARAEEHGSWTEALERYFGDISIGIQVRTFLAARLRDVLEHGQAREAQLLDAVRQHEVARSDVAQALDAQVQRMAQLGAETARAAEAHAQQVAQLGVQVERTSVELAHSQGLVEQLREDLALARGQLAQSADALGELKTQAALTTEELARERSLLSVKVEELARERARSAALAGQLAAAQQNFSALEAALAQKAAALDAAAVQRVSDLEAAAAQRAEDARQARATQLALQQELQRAAQREEELRRAVLRRDEDLAALCHSAGADVTTDTRRLQELVAGLQMDSRMLAAVLQASGSSDATALMRSIRELHESQEATRALLGEREHWIRLLLQELVRRRFNLRKRALAPHEIAFLTRPGNPS